jgi:hypothetical protein
MPYQILNAPYKFSIGGVVGDKIPDGILYLYDRTETTKPTIFEQPMYVAAVDRRDILLLKSPILAAASTNRFLVAGGNYGIADQTIDLHEILRSKI